MRPILNRSRSIQPGCFRKAVLTLLFTGFLLPESSAAVQDDPFPQLVTSLLTGTTDQRIVAAARLGVLRDSRALAPLSNVLTNDSNNLELRREAAVSLGKLADPKAFADLCDGIREPHGFVAEAAILSMGQIHHPAGKRVLADVLSHPEGSPLTQTLNCNASTGMGGPPPGIPPAAGTQLEFSVYERLKAAQALGMQADASAVPDLEAVLDEPDWRLVVSAISALAYLGDSSAIPALCAVDSKGSPSIELSRGLAVQALGGDCESLPAPSAASLHSAPSGLSPTKGPPLMMDGKPVMPTDLNFNLFKKPSRLDYYLRQSGGKGARQ